MAHYFDEVTYTFTSSDAIKVDDCPFISAVYISKDNSDLQNVIIVC